MSKPCHVLVIDDDGDIRESLTDALVDEGHEVMCAADGAQALQWLRTTQLLPGLILLDMMMPVMDGAAFRAAQRADARLRDIPVVVLSAHAELRQPMLELGVQAHYRKPIALTQLYDIVQRYC